MTLDVSQKLLQTRVNPCRKFRRTFVNTDKPENHTLLKAPWREEVPNPKHQTLNCKPNPQAENPKLTLHPKPESLQPKPRNSTTHSKKSARLQARILQPKQVMLDACAHRLAPLSEGRIEPKTGCLQCLGLKRRGYFWCLSRVLGLLGFRV